MFLNYSDIRIYDLQLALLLSDNYSLGLDIELAANRI